MTSFNVQLQSSIFSSLPIGYNRLLQQFSETSLAMAGAMSLFYIIRLIFPAFTSLVAIVPAKAVFLPWTFLTSAFLHENFLSMVLSVAAVLSLSKSIEAVQGNLGLVKLLFIALMGSGIVAFVVVIIYYFLAVILFSSTASGSRAGDVLYSPIYGFHGGLAALLVGIKQAMPESEITLFRIIQFKAKDLPVVYVCICIVWSLLGGMDGFIRTTPLVVSAMYISWFYLRFFAYRSDSFLQGDQSEDFRFASFFPTRFLQQNADAVAQAFGSFFSSKLGIQLPQQVSGERKSENLSFGRTFQDLNDFEAVRRREKGMRAMEERFFQGGNKPATKTNASFSNAGSLTDRQGTDESSVTLDDEEDRAETGQIAVHGGLEQEAEVIDK